MWLMDGWNQIRLHLLHLFQVCHLIMAEHLPDETFRYAAASIPTLLSCCLSITTWSLLICLNYLRSRCFWIWYLICYSTHSSFMWNPAGYIIQNAMWLLPAQLEICAIQGLKWTWAAILSIRWGTKMSGSFFFSFLSVES